MIVLLTLLDLGFLGSLQVLDWLRCSFIACVVHTRMESYSTLDIRAGYRISRSNSSLSLILSLRMDGTVVAIFRRFSGSLKQRSLVQVRGGPISLHVVMW